MAMDMFIRIGEKPNGNDVKGEAQGKGFENQIDVLSWSWGMTQSGTGHMLGGSGAGKVDVQNLSFTKYIDSATPPLMQSCCNGKHYAEAVLTLQKAGDIPVKYLTIKMTEVIITSVSTGGSGGEDRLTENISLNFAKVVLDYMPQKKDGKEAVAINMSWDIAKNIKG